MRKRNIFYWVLIAVLVVVPLVTSFIRETLAVNACRGTFNYASMECDTTGAAHAHIPFGARHQGLAALTVMLLFVIAIAKWVTWRRRLGE
jgi:hypothetical protein